MPDLPTLAELAANHETTLPTNAPRPLPSKLWPRLEADASGCWNFTGARSHGYGAIRLDKTGRVMSAHRVAWELTNGPVPPQMIVRHKCDNPACCNPAHLELGTHQDNSTDCVSRGRSARGEQLPQARLTAAQVLEMRRLGDAGLSITCLSRQFEISWLQARRIIRRERWGWLDA